MPKPDDLTALAVTERGRTINRTYEEVETVLKVLALSGGQAARETSNLLAEHGIDISVENLRAWRDSSFRARFIEIRQELIPQINEEIAARAMDRALQADRAEELYIDAATEKLDEVSPDKLAASALALAKAKAENITKAQLLRDRPTEIRKSADTSELLEVLRRNGVLAHDPRTHEDLVVDAVVEEDEPEVDPLKERIAGLLADPRGSAGASSP